MLIISGSSNSAAKDGGIDSLKNSKLNFGYESNGVYPGGFLHTASGYYPGSAVYYPVGAGGTYPAAAGKQRSALVTIMLPCVNNVALSGETPSYNILILA
jgi:hypothetical protein